MSEFYFVESEPFYSPQGNEIEVFESAWHSRIPVMLKGPTGSGKTRFIEYMCWRLKLPLVTVSCHEDMTGTDLLGRFLLEQDRTKWIDGPLTMAARSGSVAAYLPYFSQWVLAAICFIGAISVPLLLISTIGSKATGSFRDTELRVFIGLMIGYVAISLIAIPDLRADRAMLQTISMQTTAGFNFLPDRSLLQWPMVWVMVPVLIGGMSMSTAGGVKVMRAIILTKDIGSELGKLTYPSSVHPLALEGRRLEEGDFSAAWAYTAVFLLFVTFGVIGTGLLGLALNDSWPIVLGALTNSLAIVGHLDMPLGFAAMSGGLQIGIALLMIAGRIELLILMVLFTSTFWRYMR